MTATANGTQQPQTEPTKAMVVAADPRSSVLAFEPSTIEEGLKLCERLVRTGLLPRTIQSPEQAFIVMVAGREMGLRFMQSFRLIHVFDGKTITSAQLIIGKCKERTSICKYFTLICGSPPCQCKHERPNEPHATYETLREGAPKPTRITFTVQDAKDAALLGKDNWKKYPWQMCQNRAGAILARAEYPDIVGGLYDEDEIPMPHVAVSTSPAAPGAAAIDAQFVDGIDDLLAELGRAQTDADCIAVGMRMVQRRTQISAADEQILRQKIAERRAEPEILVTAQKKSAPRAPATPPQQQQPAASAPASPPPAQTSQPEQTTSAEAPAERASEPKAAQPTPKKREWQACGATNDGCVCSRPAGHDASHYDEKTEAEWPQS